MPDDELLAMFKPSSFGLPEEQRSNLMPLLAAAISERLDLRQRQRQLACQEAELGRRIDLLLSLTHPFSKLPRELYQQIFLACLPSGRFPILNSNEAPLLLGRVCRAWREIAMSTPQLWTSVHIAVPLRRHAAQGAVVAQRLQAHMDRAQRLPMAVSLWSTTLDNEDYDEASCDSIVQCLHDNSSRIASLKLDVSDDVLRRLAAAGSNHTWDTLEHLSLDCDPMNQYDPGRGYNAHSLSFWSSMALRSVTLLAVQDNLLRCPIHWDRLQELLIAGGPEYGDQADAAHGDGTRWSLFTAREARAILGLCPNLVNLHIGLRRSAHPLPGTPSSFHAIGPSPPLIHDHLVTLQLKDIVFEGSSGTSSFLNGLQLPSLKHLSYFVNVAGDISWGEPPDMANHPLHSFLASQSHPVRVTKLTLWKHAFTIDGLVSCLKLMPVLEGLWIRNYPDTRQGFGNAFLEAFLPVRMRGNPGEVLNTDRSDGISPIESVQSISESLAERLRLPSWGLCPRLHAMRIDHCSFTHEAIMQFALHRMDLSKSVLSDTAEESLSGQYARLRRLHMGFPGISPDYTACDARGAKNETEDCLWQDARVDARIVKQQPRDDVDYFRRTWLLQQAYDPGRGLPRQGEVVDEGWNYV